MTNHLNEAEIQKYLEEDLSLSDKRRMMQHIHSCRRCAQELQHYRQIFQMLKLEPTPPFSVQFEDEIISRLPREKSMGKFKPDLDYAWAFLGILFGFFVIWVYGGTSYMSRWLSVFKDSKTAMEFSFMPYVKNLFQDFPGEYLIIGLVIMCIYSLLDHFLRLRRNILMI